MQVFIRHLGAPVVGTKGLRTLKLLPSHENILGEVFKGTTEHNEHVIRSYNDGEMWREDALFTSD